MKHWQSLPRRTKVLFLVLFSLGAVYLISLVETRMAAHGLERDAQKELDGIHNADNDIAWEATVSRPYVIFGGARGKVEVFVRQKNGGENPSIHAVSYYYIRDDGKWKLDGSGASASEESHQKGLAVFARRNPAALQGP